MINNLYSVINQRMYFSESFVDSLLSEKLHPKIKRQFLNIIQCLGDDKIEKMKYLDQSIELSYKDIQMILRIKLDNKGKIIRIELDPIVPMNIDFTKLNELVSNISDSYVLSYCREDFEEKNGSLNKKIAIASLIKVIISVIILEAVEIGVLNFDMFFKINKSDLSFLSAGISKNDVGKKISLRELLTYMLIASDNTAMDILLNQLDKNMLYKIANEISSNFDIEFKTTKELIIDAWMEDDISEKELRFNSTNKVKWNEGSDYFVLPEVFETFARKLLDYRWTPYNDIGNIIYKGGNVPGVLSGFWANRNKKTFFYLILNRNSSFNLIEEMFCYKCAYIYMNNCKFKES